MLGQNQGASNSICTNISQPHRRLRCPPLYGMSMSSTATDCTEQPIGCPPQLSASNSPRLADGNCPAITGATILGPTLTFIDRGDVTKRLCEPLLQLRVSVVVFAFMHVCVGLNAPHRRWSMNFCSLAKSSPYKSWDGMRAHTHLSTSCNTSSPGPLNTRLHTYRNRDLGKCSRVVHHASAQRVEA